MVYTIDQSLVIAHMCLNLQNTEKKSISFPKYQYMYQTLLQ